MNPENIYVGDLRKEIRNNKLRFKSGTKFLITGGLGLIGSAIVDLLVEIGKESESAINICIADINDGSFMERYGTTNGVTFIKYDATKKLDFDLGFDYIVHCAGLASPNLYIEKPVETMLTNLAGIEEILVKSVGKPIKKIVYVSSSEIYGVQSSIEPYVESLKSNIDASSLRSSYPIAKIASELLVKSYASEYHVSALCVRPGHIFGPFFSPKDSRVASMCIKSAAHGQDIVLNSAGVQRRSFCYSLDCAGAILHLLLHGLPGEAYNIGAKSITTIRQMAKYAAEAGKVNLTVREPNEQEREQANPMNNSALDSNRLAESGFTYVFTCEEGIRHSVSILKGAIGMFD